MSKEDLNKKIVELCGQYWKKHKRILLLSKLGESLGDEKIAEIKSYERNLHQFINTNPTSEVTVKRRSAGSAEIGIVPKEVILPNNLDEIFSPSKSNFSETNDINFLTIIWDAFSAPIENGNNRWICIDDGIEIFEQEKQPSSSNKMYQIKDSELFKNFSSGKDLALSIQRWAESQDIPMEKISQKERTKNSNSASPAKSLLAEIFDSLNTNDLSRILMPLDIAEKLYKARR